MAGEAQATPVRSPAEDAGPGSPGTPERSERPSMPEKPAKPAKSAGKPAKSPKAKGKAGASGKSANVGGESGRDSNLILAEHPRAVRGIARAKAWGGLGGFLLGGYLSLPTHTLADAGLRALAAGVVCYVAAWAAAVFLWRRLVVVELRAAQQELLGVEIAKLNRSPPPGGHGSTVQ